MTPSRVPDPSELADDIAELKSMVAGLGTKIDQLPFVRSDVYEAHRAAFQTEIAHQVAATRRHIQNVDDKVGELAGRMSWIGKVAVTGFALPILVGLFFALFAAVGGGS